jgi:hypothetical protein
VRHFSKLAALAASAAAIAALIWDRAVPHEPPWVAPFGEPWLTIVGLAIIWIGVFVAAFVGQGLVRAIRDVRGWSRGGQ